MSWNVNGEWVDDPNTEEKKESEEMKAEAAQTETVEAEPVEEPKAEPVGGAREASRTYAEQPRAYAETKRETAPRSAKKAKKTVSVKGLCIAMACCLVLAGAAGFGGAYAAMKLGNKTTPENVNTSFEAEKPSNDTMAFTPDQKQPVEEQPEGETAEEPAAEEKDLTGAEIDTTPTEKTGDELSVTEIAAKCANSVVEIVTEQVSYSQWYGQYVSEGAGSGVIVSADGYIVTNNHVIEGASTIKVTTRGGDTYDAQLVGTDAESDVAVIKIEATDLIPVEFGDSDKLVVGETVVAIGNPLGSLGGTVTDGIISALDRKITIDDTTMNLLQTNAAINPGNSGGGLFNAYGQLIGIVNAKTSSTGIEGLGFAIPVNDAVAVMEQLMSQGYVSGRIDPGFTFVDITSEMECRMYGVSRIGCYVYSVEGNSDAANAGFESGDCITGVNGTEINNSEEMEAYLDTCSPGDTLKFDVVRGVTEGTITMTLTEYVPTMSTGNGFGD